jgi:hypothetical protein
MAAVATPASLLGAHNGRKLTDCPMCGQPLLDHDAIERVEHARRRLEQDVDSAIQVKAAQLAKQIAKGEHDRAKETIAALTEQVESQKDTVSKLRNAQTEALAKQKKTHLEELRKVRTTLRTEISAEAEKAAAAKVQRDLRKKDKLIGDLKEQNDAQQRRIEHLTSDERGEMNEEELVSRLHVAFPDDRIERLGRGRAGSDILHEVRFMVGDKTEVAGLVVYECKDTLQWNNGFVEQAKKARVSHDTPHVVIVSRAFPRSEKDLCVRDDVPIVAPPCLVPLAHVLREMVIDLHRAGLTTESQAAKTQELYQYLSGNEFRQAFAVIVDASTELRELLGKERTAHERTWSKRQQVYNELGGNAAAIDGRLRAIIERSNGKKGNVIALARGTAL